MSTVEAQPAGAVAAILAAIPHLQVHDVSPTIDPGMERWFMHPAPEITPLSTHAREGVAANLLTLSEHCGSHIDAPFHFDATASTMAQVPVDALLLRPYCKYDLTAGDHQPGEPVGLEHLKAAEARSGFALAPGDVAILEFGWDRNLPGGAAGRDAGWWGRNEPGLTAEACDYLAGAGVCAVACDTPACDISVADGEMSSAHGHTTAFLPQNILIIEGLTGLAGAPDTGLFLALALKIEGGSGSPARVVLLGE